MGDAVSDGAYCVAMLCFYVFLLVLAEVQVIETDKIGEGQYLYNVPYAKVFTLFVNHSFCIRRFLVQYLPFQPFLLGKEILDNAVAVFPLVFVYSV